MDAACALPPNACPPLPKVTQLRLSMQYQDILACVAISADSSEIYSS